MRNVGAYIGASTGSNISAIYRGIPIKGRIYRAYIRAYISGCI